jgi:hypothetical protein
MIQPTQPEGSEHVALQVLWDDGERVFCKAWRRDTEGSQQEYLAMICSGEQPTSNGIKRLTTNTNLGTILTVRGLCGR